MQVADSELSNPAVIKFLNLFNSIVPAGTKPAPTKIISLSGELAFADTALKKKSTKTFTISNSGNGNLKVTKITYPAGFSGSWSGTLAPGGSKTVTVTFAPTKIQSYGGNITVFSDATAGLGSIPCSGKGVSSVTQPTPTPTPTPSANMVVVTGGTLPISSALRSSGKVVSDYQIGKYELTWEEWEEVKAWAVQNGYSDLPNVGEGRGPKHPVTNVSWYNALKWCNAKSEKENLMPVYHSNVSGSTYRTGEINAVPRPNANGYRLPSESEWEWAARGGRSSKGYIYSGSNDPNPVAWTLENTWSKNPLSRTQVVGTKTPNELGIYDMSGNAIEWCFDIDFNQSRGFGRGGSWYGQADPLARLDRPLQQGPADSGSTDWRLVGLRLARSSENTPTPTPTPTPSLGMVPVSGGTLPVSSYVLPGERVEDFEIGKHEVTYGEWESVRTYAINNGYDLQGVGYGDFNYQAVSNVNWYDVLKWCNAKSQMSGLTPVYYINGQIYKIGQTIIPEIDMSANGYRLPTLAEWQWAARGGVSSKNFKFSGGNTLDFVGWYAANSNFNGPKQVGLKLPNELGLFDMSGNVLEWLSVPGSLGGGAWSFGETVLDSTSSGFEWDRNSVYGFRLARNILNK